jgi:branched-chain amino acid transport system ATP-binding protein
VPEGRQILVELTVEENLLLGATARGGRRRTTGSDVYKLFPILEERRSRRAARCPAASSRCWRSAGR